MTHTIEALANLFILNIYRAVSADLTMAVSDQMAATACRRAALILFPNAKGETAERAERDSYWFVRLLAISDGDTAYNVRRIAIEFRDFDDPIEEMAEALEEHRGIDAHLFSYYAKAALVAGPFALEKTIRKARSASVCQLSLGL
jgi:hypothetical protein